MQGGLHIDFETASPADLKRVGVHKYAEHPDTRTWGFSYRIDAGPVKTWLFGQPLPAEVTEHIASGGWTVAHGAMFERTIWNKVLRRNYPDAPQLTIEQQDCTLCRATTITLPAALDAAAAVMGVAHRKDMNGHTLMMKMAKPRRIDMFGNITWWDDPENIKHLMYVYCPQDVLAECDIDAVLPALSEEERRLWILDQKCNDRGLPLDITHAKRMVNLVELAKKRADRELRRLTNRELVKISQVQQIVAWLKKRHIAVGTMQKGDIPDLIWQAQMLDDKVAEQVITLRTEAGKNNVAKYAKMVEMTCADGRARGLLQFNGASTGRDAGRLLQPQNMTRLDYEKDGWVVRWLHQMLDDPRFDDDKILSAFEIVHGNALPWFGKAIRSFIKAEPGHKLVGGDFSNIEGRGNAWLAGEEWKLQAFRDFDAGIGPDLYKVSYARSFGKDVSEVDRQGRQVGKVQELSLGYQGGVQALLKMCRKEGANVRDMVLSVEAMTDAYTWDKVSIRYDASRDTANLSQQAWTALTIVVQSWRKAHPAIRQSWRDYQDAVLNAVSVPGTIVECAGGKVKYVYLGRYLYCQLPSGRIAVYVDPEIVTEKREFVNDDGEIYERWVHGLRFWGINSVTHKWSRQPLYGGLLTENLCQMIARDMLKFAEDNVTLFGYDVVLKVHDELLSHVRKEFGSPQDFGNIMLMKPTWAGDWPIAVQSWEDERYIK